MIPPNSNTTTSPDQKRSAEELEDPSSDEEKPDVSVYSPSPPPAARGKGKAKRSNGSRSPKKAKTTQANGEWSSEARSTIIKYIFDRGMEGLNYGELSAIVGLLDQSSDS